MFDFFTSMWQALRAFFMSIPETAAHFAVENPFMAAAIAIYAAGVITALIVFLPKTNA